MIKLLKFMNFSSWFKNWYIAILSGSIIIACLLFISFLHKKSSILYTTANNSKVLPIAVFLIPHQDDDMFMDGTIKANLDNGKQVYAVMVTDGGASNIRQKFIKGLGNFSNPPTSTQAFTAARNREFYDAMIRLGVPEDHILFANPGGISGSDSPIYRDSQLTPELATEVIKYFFDKLGNGTYYTVAAQLGVLNSTRPDHHILRNALANFTGINERYYFSEKEELGTKIILTEEQSKAKKYTLESYSMIDPNNGHFAISKYSVGQTLDKWQKLPAEYFFTQKEILREIDKGLF